MSANELVSLKLPRSVYFHDLSNFSEDRTGGNERRVFLSSFPWHCVAAFPVGILTRANTMGLSLFAKY